MLKRLFILAFIGFFGWAQAQTVSSSPWMVLTNGHYFNGVEMLPFDHIVIKDDKIYSIDGEIPRMSTPTIDCNGKYVIPGLVDAPNWTSLCPLIPWKNYDDPLARARVYFRILKRQDRVYLRPAGMVLEGDLL